jgi:hypothetical protein
MLHRPCLLLVPTLLMLAAITGCTAPLVPETPPATGPEVLINSATPAEINKLVVAKMKSIGATAEAQAPGDCTYILSSTSFAYRMMIGKHPADVFGRLRLRIEQTPAGTRIAGRLSFVRNPSKPTESETPADDKQLADMQAILNLLRDSFSPGSATATIAE